MFESFLGVNPWTALFVLLNTLLIFFTARKFLFAPVMQLITQRQKEIDGMYETAGNTQLEAESLRDRYQSKLSKAQAASDRIVKDAIARGEAREKEIIHKAKIEANAIMEKASVQIHREKKQALHEAKNEISGLVIFLAEKVVARELHQSDHVRMIDGFLAQLEDTL